MLITSMKLNVVESSCISFNSAICGDVINSYDSKLVATSQVVASITETLLTERGFANLTIIGPIAFPKCYEVARNFICGYSFPECDSNEQPVKVCQGLCDEFLSTCGEYITLLGLEDSVPSCSNLPTTNCSFISSAPKLDYESIVCPSPLTRNPNPGETSETCPGGVCCLPCPFVKNFLREGDYLRLYNFIRYLVLTFFFFSLINFLSYVVIPEKRKFPQNMIGSMFFSLSVASFFPWIMIFYQPEEIFCRSEIQTASVGFTTDPCFAVGYTFIFGSLSAISWSFCFSLNIFLMVVFMADTSKLNYFYHGLSWGLPTIVTIILASYRQFATYIAPICAIPNDNWSLATFHIPSALLLFPAFVMNVVVFVKVIQVSMKLKRSIIYILKLQFRPFLFSCYAIVIFIYNWIYVRASGQNLDEWLGSWFLCVAMGYGQNECSKISQPSIGIPTIYAVYFLVASINLVGFLLFVLKPDVINGWVYILTGKINFLTFKETSVSSSNGKSQIAITETKSQEIELKTGS